ncbi:hypothetical protein P152DRAFT_516531 [Eremomyces bilateralis CBS 781.70]|uniref:Uncharacterized protein n=1 Tax=Eremomyces bilateralis CBS 781.70 TaxID=1392243 RepID=A0A6G1FV96_9PEZI|nr:uncharacterized protein P152DRAFT_516531 [Eremomyces bilateralis CBS 781.70]KAF1809581.1 hypothetical protein P152DRAFT_516531 [Eremomyces bilateralis CBS 781.70]
MGRWYVEDSGRWKLADTTPPEYEQDISAGTELLQARNDAYITGIHESNGQILAKLVVKGETHCILLEPDLWEYDPEVKRQVKTIWRETLMPCTEAEVNGTRDRHEHRHRVSAAMYLALGAQAMAISGRHLQNGNVVTASWLYPLSLYWLQKGFMHGIDAVIDMLGRRNQGGLDQ